MISARAFWRIAWAVTLVVWAVAGALVMMRERAGWLTSYGDDVAIPAWLYIVTRNLHGGRSGTLLQRTLGRSPELAASAIFLASTATEISQYFWPHGLFPGWFDPWDIAAYAAGVGVCYAVEKRQAL